MTRVVPDVEPEVEKLMKQLLYGHGRVVHRIVMGNKKHDIRVGCETELLPSVSSQRDQANKLLLRKLEVPEREPDLLIERIGQGEGDADSSVTSAMPGGNGA